MKNIFLIPTECQTNLVRIWYNVEKTAFSFRINAEVNDSYKEYVNIYITDDEQGRKNDWVLHTPSNKVIKVEESVRRADFQKIIMTNDPTLIEDGVQEVSSQFLSFFAENPIDYVRVEKWLDDEGGRFYSLVFPPTISLSEIDEGEKLYTEEELQQEIDAHLDVAKDLWLTAIKQQKRMYNEEEVENLIYYVCGEVARLQGIILNGNYVDSAYKKFKK